MSTQVIGRYGNDASAATGAGGKSLFDRATFGLRSWLAERSRFRTTVTELEQLSDRELNDIGIAREEIELVARGLAVGRG